MKKRVTYLFFLLFNFVAMPSFSSEISKRFSIQGEVLGGLNYTTPLTQGFASGSALVGFDLYQSGKQQVLSWKIVLFFPQIEVGGYFSSQYPYMQPSIGAGFFFRVVRQMDLFVRLGIGPRFSWIGSVSEQSEKGLNLFEKRDPQDAIMAVGYGQIGVSVLLDRGTFRKSLQISLRFSNAPSRLGLGLPDSLDVGLAVGFTYNFQ